MKFKNKPIIAYVPHGIDDNLFFPINESHSQYAQLVKIRKEMLKDKHDTIKYIVFFNSRNIRRKQIPDIILGYKTFCDRIGKDKASECLLLLHTQPVDENGTDLNAVIENLAKDCNILFTAGVVPHNILNIFYNIADVTINITDNEGWGLSCTESLMAGTPVIVNATGGLQDQCRFEDENGKWIDFSSDFPSNHTGKYRKHGVWATPIYASNRSIQGSVPTPYIFSDRVSIEDIAIAINKWYKTLPDFRKAAGELGRAWVTSDEAKMTATQLGQNMIDNIDNLFNTWKPRDRYELINTKDQKYFPKHSGVLVDEDKLNKEF